MARTVLALWAFLFVLAAPAAAARPLITAIHEPYLNSLWNENELIYSRMVASGSTVTRVWLDWRGVAPKTLPPSWDAANPNDPNYTWYNVDRLVDGARQRGLRVILTIRAAPAWAERSTGGPSGSNSPDPAQLATFARAAALRYHGRVRDWEIWNEPNLAHFLSPQYGSSGESLAPWLYRDLVNAAGRAIHLVDPSNTVIAGATAPFGAPGEHRPLDFMRKLLCMSAGNVPRPTCATGVEFDAWSHHPYTQGGPNHRASLAGNVSIGDLPQMRKVLSAAARAGHVVTTGPVRFWITEFSWETKGPDQQGVPNRRHARWTAEALYRMWRSGVNLVTWWLLRDRPFPASVEQSGFFYCGLVTIADDDSCQDGPLSEDARKRSFHAFRFPFVAFPRSGRVFTWGRTPTSTAARVVVERRIGDRWRRVGTLRANQYGIFQKIWVVSSQPVAWRARIAGLGGEASLAFRLQRTRDVPLAHPFGCGGTLPC